MDLETTKRELKQALEQVKGISNVRLFEGHYRGQGEHRVATDNAYVEFCLESRDHEQTSSGIYILFQRRIKQNFPQISIDYTNPDIQDNPTNLRRITLHLDESLKPCQKESLVLDVAHNLTQLIRTYLLMHKGRKK